MSLEIFIESPWLNSHEAYGSRAFFHIRPAPEFATAEVVVASLYRAAGYDAMSEKVVPRMGKEFDTNCGREQFHKKSGSKIKSDTWKVVLHGVLESPKQQNQSSKRFLQMCPVVPDVALYSGSARLSTNSWNPGDLIKRMVSLGSPSADSAANLWESIFNGLSVSETDDIWARWLHQEFELRRNNNPDWKMASLGADAAGFLQGGDKEKINFPAQQFVRDIEGILQAKPYMTRRQWISLLEALLRLASAAHVLWLCDVNYRVWKKIRSIILHDAQPPSLAEIRENLVSCESHFLTYGNPAGPVARDFASQYLVARLGINAVLWQLAGSGIEVKSIADCTELETLFAKVSGQKQNLRSAGILATVTEIQENNSRTITCKKGIGSNVVEFIRYVLGQRQTAEDMLRGYDQGYILRKKTEHSQSPWIVSMGPVAILALVHCCLRDAAGPRSIQKLCKHLAAYGIRVHRDDVNTSDLGKRLRMLGLVLDSPDAESGMLLIPPFDSTSSTQRASK